MSDEKAYFKIELNEKIAKITFYWTWINLNQVHQFTCNVSRWPLTPLPLPPQSPPPRYRSYGDTSYKHVNKWYNPGGMKGQSGLRTIDERTVFTTWLLQVSLETYKVHSHRAKANANAKTKYLQDGFLRKTICRSHRTASKIKEKFRIRLEWMNLYLYPEFLFTSEEASVHKSFLLLPSS